MRSSFFSGSPRLRRALPWLMWALAAVIAIPLAWSQAAVGSAPAVIETRVATLASMRTGHRLRVAKVLVKPGQSVKGGDVLVQMDMAEVDADLAVARAKLVYAELLAGVQQVQLHDERARTSHALAATAERAAVDVARIVAEAEHDRSELGQLDANLEIEQKLVGDQLANADRLRALKLRRAALAKKVEEYQGAVTEARRSVSGSSRRLGEWRQEDKGAKPAPGTATPQATPQAAPATDIRTAAGDVQREEIKRLEQLRAQHEVKAPFDGRVGEVLVNPGDLSADASAPMVTVVEEQSKSAIAYVSQSAAERVHLGDLAKLVSRDLSGPALKGRVVALAPSITEIPIRFRRVPTLHEFGRNVYIQLDTPARLPGQAFDAVFNRGQGGKQ